MKITRRARSSSGQGLVEGVIGLVLVLGAGVIAVLLILNSGAGMFFKQKLMPAANMAAQFAAAHSSDPDLQEETTSFVQALLPKLGVLPSGLSVQVQSINIGQEPAMQVTLANNFPLFGSGNAYGVPSFLTISDTEIVAW